MKKGLAGVIISLLLILAAVFGVLYVSGARDNDSIIRGLRASVSEKDTMIMTLSGTLREKEDRIGDLTADLKYLRR